ncbi:MAG: amidohydrolase [Caldilinea sp.]|nr:amidohydrolase [Caldilineaceae bacterium]MCO5210367.1 amidohydrolase [Caldilinea sp.]MCW5840129.1 amidohydrolase [Caldilinea sp.]
MTTPSDILMQAQAMADQLTAWRRDIHMHPELSFQEERTANLVAGQLAALGIETQTGVGKTGVVGYLGDGGPAIAIRADMDALPIQEENDVAYASQTPGVMHACGHDAHTAILLGVATILARMPDRPAGQVRFLFQPSEEDSDDENKSGATRMIEDKALDGVDGVIALHVASDLPSKRITIVDGPASANEDSFEIWLRGTGGHGAFPHQTVDPTFILAQVLNSIHGIRARRIDPTKAAALSIGMILAGAASNVIPSQVYLSGTMRSFDDGVRQQLRDELAKVLEISRVLGGDFEMKLWPGYPAMINDVDVARLVRVSTRDLVGAHAIMEAEPMMAAEDFSYMTRKAPGAMFMLGAKKDGVERPHHTPVFDIDESAMPLGAAVLADVACRLLRQKASQ